MAVRTRLIASGFNARTLANSLPLMPDVALVAVTHGSRAEAVARDDAIALEPSVDDLAHRRDVDAVVIGLPDLLRVDAVLAAAGGRSMSSSTSRWHPQSPAPTG